MSKIKSGSVTQSVTGVGIELSQTLVWTAKNTTTEHFERLVTLETCDESDEET